MAEEQNTENQDAAGAKTGETEFKPITSQEEFERALGKRLQHERAKFADYGDLKAKAEQFEALQESQKTEQQKLAERLEAAEKRASQAERSALQIRIASEFGIPQEAVHGDDEESMRATAQKLVEWRDSGKRTPPAPKKLKSGSSGDGNEDGKSRAASALRQLRGANH